MKILFKKLEYLTLPIFKAGLKEKNIDLYADSKRAKKLNEMQLLNLDETAGKTVSNLMDLGSGEWVHPETGNLRFDARVVVLGEFYNEIAKKIDLRGDKLALSAEVMLQKDVFIGF
jgi:hypothetical protein